MIMGHEGAGIVAGLGKGVENFKVGDKVEVQIKDLDWERNRISLSLRGAQGDPWADAVIKFPQGTTFMGKITKLERFGAFAQMIPGVEGLIPIGKLGNGRRIMSAREAVTEGQEILLKVESIDIERHRASGSSRANRSGKGHILTEIRRIETAGQGGRGSRLAHVLRD